MDLDSFFVSVERLKNSAYVGIPLIIGGTADRGVVASCSYEARAFGVRSAMPVKTARQLCPQATFVRPDMDDYSKHSRLVTEIIESKSPLTEKASIDEHYLDLTGMDRFFGCMKWAHELRQHIIKESGLPISFGLSVNKTVSKIATNEIKPNGEMEISEAQVIPFLSPLSVRKMPGVGPKTYEQLRMLGITSIETLRQVPLKKLQKVLGEYGTVLFEKSRGIDLSPVVPYSEQKSISKEMTFEKDTIDIKMLNELIVAMCEQICFDLRKQEMLAGCVVIKIRYSNFETFTMQQKISYTSFDHTIMETAKALFKKLYDKRMLIRLIGVKATGLIHGTQQIDMFSDTTEQISLYQAMDKIRARYGEDKIMRSSGLLLKKL